jgi:methyl-accepting chemotaxis protein
MSQAMSSIDQIVQQNSANSEESASSSQELLSQASEMKIYVETLETAVIGNKRLEKKTLPALTDQDESERGQEHQPEPQASLQAPEQDSAQNPAPRDLIPFDDDELKDF